jgi:hypothetical protein
VAADLFPGGLKQVRKTNAKDAEVERRAAKITVQDLVFYFAALAFVFSLRAKVCDFIDTSMVI